MTSRQVKICGVNSEAAFDAAVAHRADYLGFVFFPPSPRFITAGQAAALSARHKGGPKRVGLFVNPSEDEIAAVLAALPLDILQIYATPAAIAAAQTRFGLPVWRAVGVGAADDLPAAGETADGYVIESKPPPGATRPGGNALAPDWGLLAAWRTKQFWLLAGGLNPENVTAALAQTNAPGADVSSGVESAPGVKSPELIARFIAAVRAAG